MIRFFIAHVRNGRLILDELTDLPEGTHLELVSTDDVVKNGGDLLDAEKRAELGQELEASFDEEEADQLIDAADALADDVPPVRDSANTPQRSDHFRLRDADSCPKLNAPTTDRAEAREWGTAP